MNIQELRIGNLIKVIPRENQEGLISISEIHKESIVGEMLSPRQGYQFRIKFNEITLIPLTDEWLSKFGFSKDENGNIWKNTLGTVAFSQEKQQFLLNGQIIPSKPVLHVHDLQNGYLFITGQNLVYS